MATIGNKQLVRMMIQEMNEDKRYTFTSLGEGSQYTESQKRYALEQISESGVRATARILQIPRRTLQRWCREYGVYVRRCPSWVYDWAERRHKKQQFWRRRGYY
jgi:transcriptional regulator with PAS, ATPase and Fis domain